MVFWLGRCGTSRQEISGAKRRKGVCGRGWCWVGAVNFAQPLDTHVGLGPVADLMTPYMDKTILALEYGIILAVGGLLALVLHTRASRGAA